MIDVATFLMRWLFLSNLLRNVAEIQTFPQLQLSSTTTTQQHHGHRNEAHHQQEQQQQRGTTSTAAAPPEVTVVEREAHWRNECLQTILSYPPGPHRLLMADAYRVDLVQRIASKLAEAQECLRLHRIESSSSSPKRKGRIRSNLFGVLGPVDHTENDDATKIPPPQPQDLDADTDILKALQQQQQNQEEPGPEKENQSTVQGSSMEKPSDESALASTETNGSTSGPSPSDVREAQQRIREFRDFLPQLVSSVLKSPPPVDPSSANPIQVLRQLLLDRCSKDPSWGIELCWLLEADVGRAWKTLLEHPQQTGRRLVVILPAEKAAVLAKIGVEKSAAFDLLQDAEQATAFGSNSNDPAAANPMASSVPSDNNNYNNNYNNGATIGPDGIPLLTPEPRLPSSLSQRRCSHFGDTMHFIDRLTKLSLDLRRTPTVERHLHLLSGLREMNRRVRRRMVTKGEISLDVEDNYGPNDWPRVEDLQVDMLQHSVHFPLVPQTGTWHNGEDDFVPSRDDTQVVRVLNIVEDESRVLASRERCPFLVHLEVADTNLEGDDARVYTSGAETSLGSTVEEALSMNGISYEQQQQGSSAPQPETENRSNRVRYGIPQELLVSRPSARPKVLDNVRGGQLSDPINPSANEEQAYSDPHSSNQYYQSYQGSSPKHQYQYPIHAQHQQQYQNHHEQIAYQDSNVAYGYPDPAGVVRQEQIEQLHWQTHGAQGAVLQYEQPVPPIPEEPKLGGKELLNAVFGDSWKDKCNAVKQSSHFGKVDGWRLASFIIKAGEDIRKEAMVMQVISMMRKWFEAEIPVPLRPFMRPYTIMTVGGDAGLVECLSDAKSVDEVKKKTDGFESLRDFFDRAFGPPGVAPSPGETSFDEAQDNFLRSLVGYSLVCFVLQIKDRHNANILLDRSGHIMHIDFGFILGDIPKMSNIPLFHEKAPFKLSGEFWDVLGGWDTRSGGLGVKFCKMFERAFECAANHVEEIATLVETTMMGLNYDPTSARIMANGVRSRLRMRGPPGSKAQKQHIVELVSVARASLGTSTYDWLQKNMNGYQ